MKKIGFMGLMLSQLFGCAATGPITVEEISQLSDAKIRYTSEGCFHSDSYEIIIQNNVLQVAGGLGDREVFRSKDGIIAPPLTYLGHVSLDQKKIADLNKMFEYFSAANRGSCGTGSRKVELSYTSMFGQNVVTRLGHYNCVDMSNDDSYTLSSVIREVEMKQKRL